jgi:CRISPR-associated protein Cmr3
MTMLKFSAFDTLFFREARPMESVGGKPLEGRFPPTARSVAGAVRSVVGEAMEVDWQAYRQGDSAQQAVRAIIGAADADGIGALDLRGPFPTLKGERLYPAPLHLLHKPVVNEPDLDEYVRLQPGNAVSCDLGKVYLPEMAKSLPGAKPLELCWLTKSDLVCVLSGGVPKAVVKQEKIFNAEGRLGIRLNANTRSAEDGKLYQTVHARILPDVEIGVVVAGLPDVLNGKLNQILRLGGEGRFASVESVQAPSLPQVSKPVNAQGVLLMLCTAADFSGNWLPPGFEEQTDAQGVTVWSGEIAGVRLTLRCAVLGKTQREGGWDLHKHRSRAAVSFIPAGSVYFCEAEGDLLQVAKQLNGIKIGNETKMGRGELAVGFW